MNRYRNHVLAIASISFGLLVAAPAGAGTYAKVNQSDWQQGVTGLPTYVNMYTYLPTTLASKPPVVAYTHHCQGSASSSHSSMASLEKIADTNGFIVLYPEATGENCWDAGSVRSMKHGGGGDTGAVAQQVKYLVSKYNADATRVYAAGDSSGGIMTEALLGVYPDVFMAGISIMGVPCGCWASGYNDTTGTGSTAQWSGNCANGSVTHTGKEWGDLVRSYFPDYTGHRPRLQHWHGTSDTMLNYKNMAEDIKEWTNLLGLSETPTGTEQNTPKSGTTHQYWKNSCYTVYETFALSGVGHAVSVDGATIAAYFGLDKAGGQDPETAACPGAVPGGGGTGGAGGVSGSGGTTGSGGAGGARDGGREVGTPGTGGVQETGGLSGSGGAVGTGGSGAASTGGRSGNGGAVATGGGSAGSGGTSAKGGTSGDGGAVGTGGSVGSGGSSAMGGAGGNGSGGSQGSGGASAQGGISGSGGSTIEPGVSSNGCGCTLGSRAPRSPATVALPLVALGLIIRRQRRVHH
jgi:acetylxylan esterase